MARTLASGNALSNASVAAPAQDSTFFIRLKPSWSSGDAVGHCFFMYFNASPLYLLAFVKDPDDAIYAGVISVSGSHYIPLTDTGFFTSGVWANWRLEVEGSAGDVRLYKNGTLVGSGVVTPGAFAASGVPLGLSVGLDQAGNRWAAADTAELAEWDHILSGPDSALLESSGNPSCVPSGLVRHYKILGDDSPEPDEIGSDDLTLVGTPAQATHPTVSACSGAQTVTLPLLAAAGSFYNPTVTPGPVTVTLPLLAAGGAFYSPTVINTQIVTLPLLEAAGAFYSPVVSMVRPPGIRVTVSDSLAQG